MEHTRVLAKSQNQNCYENSEQWRMWRQRQRRAWMPSAILSSCSASTHQCRNARTIIRAAEIAAPVKQKQRPKVNGSTRGQGRKRGRPRAAVLLCCRASNHQCRNARNINCCSNSSPRTRASEARVGSGAGPGLCSCSASTHQCQNVRNINWSSNTSPTPLRASEARVGSGAGPGLGSCSASTYQCPKCKKHQLQQPPSKATGSSRGQGRKPQTSCHQTVEFQCLNPPMWECKKHTNFGMRETSIAATTRVQGHCEHQRPG